jgi:hypothetical protein
MIVGRTGVYGQTVGMVGRARVVALVSSHRHSPAASSTADPTSANQVGNSFRHVLRSRNLRRKFITEKK